MNKQYILQDLAKQLTHSIENAKDAAQAARKDATHDQSKAETQYDSLGTEMSYLADGQNQRLLSLQQALNQVNQFNCQQHHSDDAIKVGSLVSLTDIDTAKTQHYIILPFCGGSQVITEEQSVTVVTPQSPFAKKLINKFIDDEVEISTPTSSIFEITHIC